MNRKLKALGLALVAISAMSAVAAPGASAVIGEHEFHTEGPSVLTGRNIGNEKFAVGTAGTVECTTSAFESTQAGTEVSSHTFKSDTLTVTPRYTGCTFGGQPATVNFNHCAYVLDSDTTTGNPDGGLHANVEIECLKNGKGEDISWIEIDTSVCTITIKSQTINHALSYENDTAFSTIVRATARKIVTGKAKTTESQTGCLLFPTGAIGTYTGSSTVECFSNEGSALSGTEKTTPQGLTKENLTTACRII